jgi:hypothetical protein
MRLQKFNDKHGKTFVPPQYKHFVLAMAKSPNSKTYPELLLYDKFTINILCSDCHLFNTL